jgi:hypothetical protein
MTDRRFTSHGNNFREKGTPLVIQQNDLLTGCKPQNNLELMMDLGQVDLFV